MAADPHSIKPPGCIYARKNRYWWRGRLPNETKPRARKIVPRNSNVAVLARPEQLGLARTIVWRWWEDAAGQAAGQSAAIIPVADLVARFQAHAREYYCRKDGTQTGEAENVEHATRLLTSEFGSLPADLIDVEHIERLQSAMIAGNLARSTINKRVNIIRRMYRWAGARKLVPPSTWQAILIVENLRQGRSRARETQRVGPADERSVEHTLPFLPGTVRTMVELHRLAGFRSTELCIMRPANVDRGRGRDIWVYRPAWHKTQHLEQERAIPLGPQAQRLLLPFLDRPGEAYCFSPAEAMAQRWIAMRGARQTAVQPSQQDRRQADPSRRRQFAKRYDRRSYWYAIKRAIAAAQKAAPAGVELVPWRPHQLRHAFLTRVGRQFGAEVARASGGHSSLDATEIYLERDLAAAENVARTIG